MRVGLSAAPALSATVSGAKGWPSVHASCGAGPESCRMGGASGAGGASGGGAGGAEGAGDGLLLPLGLGVAVGEGEGGSTRGAAASTAKNCVVAPSPFPSVGPTPTTRAAFGGRLPASAVSRAGSRDEP